MNIKEAACLLGWKSEQVAAAIGKGVICGKWGKISLRAAKCGTDYEITDSDIDAFLQKFETEEPLPLSVSRRQAKAFDRKSL